MNIPEGATPILCQVCGEPIGWYNESEMYIAGMVEYETLTGWCAEHNPDREQDRDPEEKEAKP